MTSNEITYKGIKIDKIGRGWNYRYYAWYTSHHYEFSTNLAELKKTITKKLNEGFVAEDGLLTEA